MSYPETLNTDWTIKPFEEGAAKWAKSGRPVVPIHRVMEDGICSCQREDCKSPGKHPITQNGFKDAANDPESIAFWTERFPWANIAVPTGLPETFDVLDVDTRNGGSGLDTLKALEGKHEALDTLGYRTPSGGYHLFFDGGSLVRCRGNVLPGVDIRSAGGYVVVSPSVGVGGRYVRFRDAAIATPPEWLLEALESGSNGLSPTPDMSGPIIAGNRNDALTRIAGSLWRDGNAGHTPTELEAMLMSVNELRCSPPLAPREVSTIARSVTRYNKPRATAPTKTESMSGPVVRKASTLQTRSVMWLKKHYVPRAALTILQGHGSVGKGTYTVHLAAELTRGELTGTPGRAMFVVAEDSAESVLKPRLLAAGADLDEVDILTWQRDGFPAEMRLPDDLETLAGLLPEHNVDLLVIDPLMSHLAANLNSYSDHQVKLALTPLHKIAEDSDCSIMGVHHFTKNTENGALYSGQGSGAFVNTARCVLSMVEDEESGLRVVEVVKSNNGPKNIGRSLSLEFVPVDGMEDTVPTILDLGEASMRVDDILVANRALRLGEKRKQEDEPDYGDDAPW